MNKKELINKLVEIYKQAQISGESAMHLDIVYTSINKMFSIEIDGNQYLLSSNDLSDLPDGVGDELANKIKLWSHK